MTADSDALADLLAVRDGARDLQDAVASAVVWARSLCLETAWQARAADAFHAAVVSWTADLAAVRELLVDLETEAAEGALRLTWRLERLLDHGATP